MGSRLFVPAWNGTRSRWYRSAMEHRGGLITAAGGSYDVLFAPADPALRARIDAAYNSKYAGSPYLPPMVSHAPQSATVETTPRAVTSAE